MVEASSIGVTVVILARNEEDVIERCIRSAFFAKEILVVDSGSTDSTPEIAQRLGARVVAKDWPGDFSIQRNFADANARFPWVLQLDADEIITAELAGEISDFFARGLYQRYSAGQFPRKELIFGRWIEHGGWYPQYKLRLYRKGSGNWTGNVHEHFTCAGEIYKFHSEIRHDSYKDVHTFITKFNAYTSLGVREKFSNKKKFSLLKIFFQPLERFWGRYVVHKGYRDGFHGFIIASLISLTYFIEQVKLWEMYYKEKNNR
jgi:glycosyltransferase involved in cell wall biosynthesis